MAFDAGMVAALAYELNTRLVGARVEKVHQPEKDEILLSLRTSGESLRLTISASVNNPRIHISAAVKENPPVPPMFCIMLRKYLSGAKISDVSQIGFERVIRLTFDGKDEMGFAKEVRLYHEIMGKYTNLIFTDGEDKIIGAIRTVDFTTSQKRQVLPGMRYELPPAQDKIDPLTETEEHFVDLIADTEPSRSTTRFILDNYLGISSLTAREIAARSAETIGESPIKLKRAFFDVVSSIKDHKFTPCMAVDSDGRPIDYSFIPLCQYDRSDDVSVVTCTDFSSMLETFFAGRDRSDRVKQRAFDLLKTVNNAISRLEKKISLQRDELSAAAKKDEYKKMGDLITGGMYMLKKGMKSASLVDYSDPSLAMVEVELDVRLSPAANAQRWYKRYNKAKTAEIELKKQIDIATAELEYLRSVLDNLERASGQSELDEIRDELCSSGYKGLSGNKKGISREKIRPSKPLEFVTSGGYRLLCGKNNLQNEMIRTKLAGKRDWWFHVKNAPGSHVVMICGDAEPSEIDFTEAAIVAACHSSLAEAKNIAVDYTRIKNLKKPSGSKPGYVIYYTNYSAYVTPNDELCKKLSVDKGN